MPFRTRVAARTREPAIVDCLVARLGKTDERPPAEADVAALAVDRKTLDPRFGTTRGDNQEQGPPATVARLRQLGPLTDDNLLIFRDRTPKGRHYTERPGDPLTGLQDSSFGAGCFGNAKSS